MKNTVIRALFTLLLLQIAAAFAYANGPGNLDLTFAGTGYVMDARYPFLQGLNVIIQVDGKIVVCGGTPATAEVSRLNPDGTLDTSFGNGGRILPNEFFGFPRSGCTSLLLQPDGKILFVGGFGNIGLPGGGGAVVRFNSDGTPDTSFDVDGLVWINFNIYVGAPHRAALGPDGKIAVQGVWADPRFGSLYGGMARYNSDGSVDTTFGDNGSMISGTFGGVGLTFQADGKMVGGVGGMRVARYNANGSLDTSFDGDGTSAAPSLPGNPFPRTLALLPDGKILAAGEINNEPNLYFCIVRYNGDGSLDTTFNGTGTVVTSVPGSYGYLSGLGVQTDGRIVAGGNSLFPGNTNDLVVVRYNVNGSLDTTYGSNGKAVIDLGFSDSLSGMVLDSADRAVLVGTSQTAQSQMAFVARITSEAAPLVEVGGRVTSTNGMGISNATIILKNSNNEKRYALSNAFGYYVFSGVSSNETYVVSASNKRYRFQPPTRTITLINSVADVDFIGNTGTESLVDSVIGDGTPSVKTTMVMNLTRQ
jgi:uncharacterized delta-60 repeat protein